MYDGSADVDTLIADLCVHGFWEPQTDARFDTTVFDTDAKSCHGCSPLMFWVQLRLRRTNIHRRVRLDMVQLLHFVFWQMGCWVLRLRFC